MCNSAASYLVQELSRVQMISLSVVQQSSSLPSQQATEHMYHRRRRFVKGTSTMRLLAFRREGFRRPLLVAYIFLLAFWLSTTSATLVGSDRTPRGDFVGRQVIPKRALSITLSAFPRTFFSLRRTGPCMLATRRAYRKWHVHKIAHDMSKQVD
ncbi:hypothetical protein F5Y08DRAFT_105956 [Xylaria arbuscula]|nr:hypothetical protein F5Y08DRAFT_105956 [Xylaria arbuscula]